MYSNLSGSNPAPILLQKRKKSTHEVQIPSHKHLNVFLRARARLNVRHSFLNRGENDYHPLPFQLSPVVRKAFLRREIPDGFEIAV